MKKAAGRYRNGLWIGNPNWDFGISDVRGGVRLQCIRRQEPLR